LEIALSIQESLRVLLQIGQKRDRPASAGGGSWGTIQPEM
jgi:hypothetical protein